MKQSRVLDRRRFLATTSVAATVAVQQGLNQTSSAEQPPVSSQIAALTERLNPKISAAR